MTAQPVPASDHPRDLLSISRDLTRRVRAAQRGAWFPLGLFGGLTLAAIPVYRLGHRDLTCRSLTGDGGLNLRACAVYVNVAFVYWPIALMLAYVAITAFYLRRSHERGIGTPIRPYVIVGVVLALLLSGASLWGVHHPPVTGTNVYGLQNRLTSASSAIGLGLLVLAWVERSWALLVSTIGYLTVVLVPVTLGWTMTVPWNFVPHFVICGGLLLIGGAGFALAELRARTAAS